MNDSDDVVELHTPPEIFSGVIGTTASTMRAENGFAPSEQLSAVAGRMMAQALRGKEDEYLQYAAERAAYIASLPPRPPLTRWQRLRRAVRYRVADIRYTIARWIVGYDFHEGDPDFGC